MALSLRWLVMPLWVSVVMLMTVAVSAIMLDIGRVDMNVRMMRRGHILWLVVPTRVAVAVFVAMAMPTIVLDVSRMEVDVVVRYRCVVTGWFVLAHVYLQINSIFYHRAEQH